MVAVEVGFKLNKSYIYYENILKEHGLECVFECTTRDIYYTNEDFSNIDNMTEKEINNACIRIRQVNDGVFSVQNADMRKIKNKYKKLNKLEKTLQKHGFRKIFDTIKFDHHWYKEGMNTRIQLQEIKDIGLVVYFDNKEYYKYNLDEQRKKLIDELNSYGFSFNYDDLGIDKLRTLYYRKEKYSKNQNG